MPQTDITAAARSVCAAHPEADQVIARLTVWPSVLGMLRAAVEYPSFRPTLTPYDGEWPHADIFDTAMAEIGDPRRADRVLQ